MPVDESGVRLSDELIVRLHDGRAVAHAVTDKGEEPRSLLDHNFSITAGGCEFLFEHSEFDPAGVTQIFPEITPCDPFEAKNDGVQNHFVR